MMPSKTLKQARTMRAAEHDPTGIPQKVAKDFVAADKKTNKFGYGRSKKGK